MPHGDERTRLELVATQPELIHRAQELAKDRRLLRHMLAHQALLRESLRNCGLTVSIFRNPPSGSKAALGEACAALSWLWARIGFDETTFVPQLLLGSL
jgi:hypothetical protein